MLFKIFTYICAVFLHWVGHFVILVAATFPRKEAFLAHIKVETFKAAVSKKCILVKPGHRTGFPCHVSPETLDGVLLADVALGLVPRCLRRREPDAGKNIMNLNIAVIKKESEAGKVHCKEGGCCIHYEASVGILRT